jgi:hypothetical protein
MAELKAAIYMLLKDGPAGGLRNADIGRALGIYVGHVEHEGHIPRTLLALMEREGVVQQEPQSKRWTICQHQSAVSSEEGLGANCFPLSPLDKSNSPTQFA